MRKNCIVLLILFVFVNSKTDAQTAVNSLTQYGITWTFDKPYLTGTFINGDYWVKGPVTIIDITPKSTKVNGRIINGSMLNASLGKQGFDNWMLGSENRGWDSVLNVARPNGTDLSSANSLHIANGSLISSISYSDIRESKNVRVMAVLTVLDTIPPAGSFRPPYIGKEKGLNHPFNDSIINKLPNVALAPTSLDYAPETQRVLSLIEKPWVELMGCWVNEMFCAPENMPCYGRDIANVIGNAACQVVSNINTTDKKLMAIRLIQIGIDNYGIIKNDPFGRKAWQADGGHSCGRAFPILFAGFMLSDTAMFNIMKKSGQYAYQNGHSAGNLPSDYIHFGEQDQTFYVTQQAVDITHNISTIAWDPDSRSPRIPYESTDIGKAVWGVCHALSPGGDNNHPRQIYLEVNLPSWPGQLLASHLLGIKDAWNNPALFDCVDNFVKVAQSDVSYGSGGFFDNFVRAMWITYRSSSSSSLQINKLSATFNHSVTSSKHGLSYTFSVPTQKRVSIQLLTLSGKSAAFITDKIYSPGTHTITCTASDIMQPPGMYIYHFAIGVTHESGMVTLLK
jgi:hypothetical protein